MTNKQSHVALNQVIYDRLTKLKNRIQEIEIEKTGYSKVNYNNLINDLIILKELEIESNKN